MTTSKLTPAQTYRLPRHTIWCTIILTSLGVLAAGFSWQMGGNALPLIGAANASASGFDSLFDKDKPLPSILSVHDTSLYQAIFRVQKKADWSKADVMIKQLSNKLLLGHVLAQRYLSNHFEATSKQLADWLNQYNDLPQASAIYA